MADELVRDPVNTPKGGSGVNMGFNIDTIAQAGKSVGTMLQAGEQALTVLEKQRRNENEEMAQADMIAFSARLSEMKTGYDVAVSQTVDPKEIDSITNSYNKEIDQYVNNDRKFRNKLGRGEAVKYIKKHNADVNNQVMLRKAAINQKDSLSKLDYAIAQVKKNPIDVQYSDKLNDIYDEKISMGVMTEGDKILQLEIDQQQQQRDVAGVVTAGFENNMNQTTTDFNTAIGQVWSNYAQGQISEEQANKLTVGLQDRFNAITEDEMTNYKTTIESTTLSPVEKRTYLRKLDANVGYSKAFMKNIKDQMAEGQKKAENNNIMKFQDWQIQNPNTMASLQELRSAGLPDDYIIGYQKKWTSAREAGGKGDPKIDALKFDSISRDLRNINPNTDQSTFNDLIIAASKIGDTTLRSKILQSIENKRDPKKYNQQIDDYIGKRSKNLSDALTGADIEFPNKTEWSWDFSWKGVEKRIDWMTDWGDPDATENQLFQAQWNIEQEARKIYAEKGFEPAKKFMDEAFNKLDDAATADQFVESYVLTGTDIDVESFNVVPERGQLSPNNEIIFLSGKHYIIDRKKKTMRPVVIPNQ